MAVVSHHHNTSWQHLRELVDADDLAFIVVLLAITLVVAAAMFAPPSFFVR
jgi:hypothetical protein